MTKMKGLEYNQAIDCGDHLLVKLAQGKYKVGAEEVTVSYNGLECAISKGSEIVRIITTIGEITHYIVRDTDQTFSVDDVQRLRTLDSQYRDEYDEYNYPSLEVEMEVRKQTDVLNKIVAVREPDTVNKQKVEFSIVGSLLPTGSKFVTSTVSIGMITESMYSLNKLGVACKALMDVANKFGLDYECSSSSGLRYAKIGGKYIMSGVMEKQPWCDGRFPMSHYSDLSTALSEEKRLYTEVFKYASAKVNPSDIESGTVRQVYNELESILTQIKSIDYKQKSSSTHSSVCNRVRKLMSQLEDV